MNGAFLIPARGGSKGIFQKNIRSFLGRPLIHYTLELAVGRKYPVYVSTDSDEIASSVKNFSQDVGVIARPDCFSHDRATTDSVVGHFLSMVKADFVIILQCTSPLKTKEHLAAAEYVANMDGFESLVSVVRTSPCTWRGGVPSRNRSRRQDMEPLFQENGAIYGCSRESFEKNSLILDGRVDFIEMPRWTLNEIDDIDDIELCETIYRRFVLGPR